MTEDTNTTPTSTQPLDEGSSPTRKRPKPGERRIMILETVAQMLENPAAEKITTAGLAKKLGVSEAALYRHFASKAQMYEGLIGFIEQSLFGIINQIMQSDQPPSFQAMAVTRVLLEFSKKNKGMTRILTGEALIHEDPRLAKQLAKIVDRLELSYKQIFKLDEGYAIEQGRPTHPMPPQWRAQVLLHYVLGAWLRYTQSHFTRLPNDGLEEVLPFLIH